MKIYGQGNVTLVEITKLIDDIFNQTMQIGKSVVYLMKNT